MARSKGPRTGPRILNIRKWADRPDRWAVRITMKQLMRVPQWVWEYHLNWYHDASPHHVEVIFNAKDELEAMMRFNKLWAALPKIGE